MKNLETKGKNQMAHKSDNSLKCSDPQNFNYDLVKQAILDSDFGDLNKDLVLKSFEEITLPIEQSDLIFNGFCTCEFREHFDGFCPDVCRNTERVSDY